MPLLLSRRSDSQSGFSKMLTANITGTLPAGLLSGNIGDTAVSLSQLDSAFINGAAYVWRS
jgi:hypothetical protein